MDNKLKVIRKAKVAGLFEMRNPLLQETEDNELQYKTGVLLVNLGTPDSPTPWGVMKFLRKFLSDPRVVPLPTWLWWLILHAVVLPLRIFRVSRNYQKIWMKEGSPLRVLSEQLAEHLSLDLSKRVGFPVPVFTAMTYGNPSIPNQFSLLEKQKISRLLVLPLFPFYSGTTTGAAFDALVGLLYKKRCVPSLFFIHEYGLEESYLTALGETISEYWAKNNQSERLLFSFHGIPKRNQELGDPYGTHCFLAANALAKKLKIPENFWKIGFQSRFGFNEWLQPFTDQILATWAMEGVKSVDIVSPSFAVDCLETLEELCIQSRSRFIEKGGIELRYIPAMNVRSRHVSALGDILFQYF